MDNSLYLIFMKAILNKTTRVVGIAILTVFVFLFLHSELDLLNHEGENHSTHDHCTIVNGSTTPTSKPNTSELTKLKVQFVFTLKLIEEENHSSSTYFLETDNPHFTNKTNKVYLTNNTFLI